MNKIFPKIEPYKIAFISLIPQIFHYNFLHIFVHTHITMMFYDIKYRIIINLRLSNQRRKVLMHDLEMQNEI